MLMRLHYQYCVCVIMKKGPFPTCNFPLTRKALAMLKLRTVRCGMWFKNLCRDERNLLELTIRVTKRVKSFILVRLISVIVEKLLMALEGKVAFLARTVGKSIAKKLSNMAKVWGNKSASKWSEDSGFIRYLAVMQMNNPLGL
jgi:hypothetical protein